MTAAIIGKGVNDMLDIDTAIKHCLEVAGQEEKNSKTGKWFEGEDWNIKAREQCAECAAEHRQLAEWLTDYKELKNSIGAVKLSNMKEALALIRTLKAELNGWQENPFDIIAEMCGAVTDCRRCQWHEKCPLPKNCGGWKLS